MSCWLFEIELSSLIGDRLFRVSIYTRLDGINSEQDARATPVSLFLRFLAQITQVYISLDFHIFQHLLIDIGATGFCFLSQILSG
jgi:hypothetical protein